MSQLDRSEFQNISLLSEKKYGLDAMEVVPLNFMPEAFCERKQSAKSASENSSLLLMKQLGKTNSQEPNGGDLESLSQQETKLKSRIMIVDDIAINVVFLKLQLQQIPGLEDRVDESYDG